MRDRSTTVEHWLGLAHEDLAEHIRAAVRSGSGSGVSWSEVAAQPVLAARVRGILSALESQMADHRDHAMWTMWINRARRALNEAPPVAEPARPARPVAPPVLPQLPAVSVVAAAPPRRQPHLVTPVTFLAPGQAPTDTTEE